MRTISRRRFVVMGLAVVLLFFFSGCGPYVRASKRYSEFSSGLQADLPEGWLQYTEAKNGYTITRDGLRLEKITIRTTRVGKKIEGIDRVYNAGMMPHEVADLSVGLAKAQSEMRSFEIRKIDAARVAGQDGYRVDAVYIDEGGLHKGLRMYGAILGKYVCELVYEAAEPVYFQKYENTFQNIVSSLKVGR